MSATEDDATCGPAIESNTRWGSSGSFTMACRAQKKERWVSTERLHTKFIIDVHMCTYVYVCMYVCVCVCRMCVHLYAPQPPASVSVILTLSLTLQGLLTSEGVLFPMTTTKVANISSVFVFNSSHRSLL